MVAKWLMSGDMTESSEIMADVEYIDGTICVELFSIRSWRL